MIAADRAAFVTRDIEVVKQLQLLDQRLQDSSAELAHIKDVLAFLRIVVNPRDEASWRRLLLLIPGVGPAKAAALYRYLAQSGHALEAVESAGAMALLATACIGAESTWRRRPIPSTDIPCGSSTGSERRRHQRGRGHCAGPCGRAWRCRCGRR